LIDRRAFAAVLLALAASACGGTSGPAPVATVSVTLSPASLVVGQTSTATAGLLDAGGAVISGRSVAWSSSAPGVATVTDSGVITAVALGSATITATIDGVSGSATAYVLATGVVPARMEPVTALGQTAAPSSPVFQPPAVQVTDASGQVVPGVAVTFSVTAGGGRVTGGSAVTDGSGVARLQSWVFGAAGGQSVQATSASLPGVSVDFAGLARPSGSGFDITLRFLTPMTDAQATAFVNARERIQEIIVGDIPSFSVVNASCGGVTVNETVDDVLILAKVGTKDGPGNVLAESRACWLRPTGNPFPVVGSMLFDVADVDALGDRLETVVLHEMLHVVGFATIWSQPEYAGIVSGAGTGDPYFTGTHARTNLATLNDGAAYSGNPVPLENQGTVGDGTRDYHWRDTVFGRELMTGFINSGANPLSATTIGSLQDLGYVVDVSKADPFDLARPLASLLGVLPGEEPPLSLQGDVHPEPPGRLGSDGRPLTP
jgi:hypothetical protein